MISRRYLTDKNDYFQPILSDSIAKKYNSIPWNHWITIAAVKQEVKLRFAQICAFKVISSILSNCSRKKKYIEEYIYNIYIARHCSLSKPVSVFDLVEVTVRCFPTVPRKSIALPFHWSLKLPHLKIFPF